MLAPLARTSGRPDDRDDRHRREGLDRAQPARARRDRRAAPLHVERRTAARARPDAFFLANGPGDPAALDYVVETVRGLVGKKPVYGICLGHQLLCRAVGLETYKLPFGHRGSNHPVKDLTTGRVEITSQNHGFAVLGPGGAKTLAERRAGPLGDRLRRRRADAHQPLRPHGRGARAARRAGRHRPVPPGGRPRPARRALPVRPFHRRDREGRLMPRRDDIKKILIIGSGPIVIGQAAEFDYSGTQACKVLMEEGYEVVLVNSNPATIMTDPEIATATYVEPLLPGPVAQVIERERPDALLPTLGGQTALNLAKALHEDGTLARFDVELIGADYEAIDRAEDRDRFRETMATARLRVPGSSIATTIDEALAAQERIGLPAIIRPAFTLGGRGGGIARTPRGVRRDLRARHRRLADRAGADRRVGAGLGRVRAGGDARPRRQRRDRLLDREPRPDGRPHGRLGLRRAAADAHGQALPAAARPGDRGDPRRRRRDGRLERAVRRQPGDRRDRRDRDEPARLALVRARLEGDRLPDREDRRTARGRLHAPGDRQRHHARHAGELRADDRLLRRQVAALRVREVPRLRRRPLDAHEVGRRGDGDRPHVPAGVREGAALARAGRAVARRLRTTRRCSPRWRTAARTASTSSWRRSAAA